jgi:Lipocalin-like domain
MAIIPDLRERLVGAWRLQSYLATPVDGGEPFAPLGTNPQGLIIYTRTVEGVAGAAPVTVGVFCWTRRRQVSRAHRPDVPRGTGYPDVGITRFMPRSWLCR